MGTGWGRAAVTRRGVVLSGGVVAAGAVAGSGAPANHLITPLLPAAGAWTGIRVERIRRASDLLVANLVINQLTYTTIQGVPYLVAGAVNPGYLGLVLPGQSVGEHVAVSQVPPVAAELAQPTILGFQVPTNGKIPYDIDRLLDLAGLTPLYDASGSGPATMIEAPYRLQIQPHSVLRWLNDTAPKAINVGGVRSTELWHARLASLNLFGDKRPDPRSTLFKVVSIPRELPGTPLALPLSPAERTRIVTNAATFDTVVDANGRVTRAPVAVDEVIVSPLGASLELHGRWPGATLLAWDHRATLGRDNYVRTVLRGWIAPFRHPAALITETVRTMRRHPANPGSGTPESTEALLIKRGTLVITEPVADTTLEAWRTGPTTVKGTPFPFTSVRCQRTVVPEVSNAADLGAHGGVVETLAVGAAGPIQLPFTGTDHSGREVPFSSAVWFEPADRLRTEEWLGWNAQPSAVRVADVPRVDVTIAPEHPDHPGLTTLPVEGMLVRIEKVGGPQPPWRPVARIDADVPAVSALSSSPSLPVAHVYHSDYVADENNAGGVVLTVEFPSGSPVDGGATTVDPKATGGLLKMPSYQGMSRKVGAVLADDNGALHTLSSGLPTIKQLFGDLTLIGTLKLVDIIPPLGTPASSPSAAPADAVDDVLGSIPGVTHEVRDGRVYVDMDLTFPLKFFRAGPLAFLPGDNPLQLKAHAEGGAGGPSETSIDARLREVALEFARMIAIPVVELRAQWESGAKPVFSFEIDNIRFLEELSFLQPLSNLVRLGAIKGSTGTPPAPDGKGAAYTNRAGTVLAGAASGSGPSDAVDTYIDEEGLHLVAETGVPDIGVGVFTLTGLNFGAGVDLPFGGGIEVHLFFASYDNPFTVTFSGFGGTGFVDVAISGRKQVVKASIGVAATLGIDLVVASGSLSVNVGFVLIVENDDDVAGEPDIGLQAYFRISGSVSVPLICTVSVVFELILEFRPGADDKPSKLTGTARFLLKVDTLIFDDEVEARLSRTFKGGSTPSELTADGDPFASGPSKNGAARMAGPDRTLAGDFDTAPTFRTTHPDASTWQQYAANFAKEPA